MLSKPNFFQQPVNQRWQITKKLKAGGFGSVYLTHDINNKKKQYAIKLIPGESKSFAEIEQKMYGLIQKQHFTNGFVKYYETGQFMKSKYLLMELIGKDLDQLKKIRKGERFSLKSVLMIGLQVIDRLQALHKIGYLHRDVKPDNLAIGLLEKNKVIYIFDFGLALPIGSGIPKQEKGKVVGTLGFMSCRSHEGKQQGPSDDLQSLIYTLIYLAQGSLPWLKLKVQNSADFHKILLMKRELPKKHGRGDTTCQELLQILGMLQQTKADQKVEYLKIKYRLVDALKKRNLDNDFVFDWCGNTERLSSPSKDKERNSEDSPRRNKRMEVMNQENQQLVQNQIYQVYKFMEGKKEPNKQKQEKIAKKSAEKKDAKKKEVSKQKIEKKNEAKKRPASAANIKPQPVLNNWDKIMQFQKSNMVSGPKIVINKTAKHKI